MTRKRGVAASGAQSNRSFHLYEELMILIGPRAGSSLTPDPLSICLRAAILGELIIEDMISCNQDGMLIAQSSAQEDKLLAEALKNIRKAEFDVQRWLGILNGETFSVMHRYPIKKARFKVYRMLQDKRIFNFRYSFYHYNAKLVDNSARIQVVDEILGYLQIQREKDLRMDILVCCLFFCESMSPLFTYLTPRERTQCRARADDITSSYRSYYRRESKKEDMVASLLKELFLD